jgi:hypothetical protein
VYSIRVRDAYRTAATTGRSVDDLAEQRQLGVALD